MPRATKPTVEQSPEPSHEKPRVYTGRPQGLPRDYRAMRVWTGNHVGDNSVQLEELPYEDYAQGNWDALEKLLRARYKNQRVHVRCYGGKQKVAWFIPRMLRMGQGDESGVAIDQINELTNRCAELERENRTLRYAVRHGKPMPAALAGADPVDPPEEEEEEEVEPYWLTFAKDMMREYGPIVKEFAVSYVQQKMVARAQTIQDHTMQNQTGYTEQTQHFADAPAESSAHPGADEGTPDGDEELTTPDDLLDFMETIDWDRTPSQKVVVLFEAIAPTLPWVKFKGQP